MKSCLDIFKIGIGPSSSHTVGPMVAAQQFATLVCDLLPDRGTMARIEVELWGSLGFTGRGHGTDVAIIGGLLGQSPSSVDPSQLREVVFQIHKTELLHLLGKVVVPFTPSKDIHFIRRNTKGKHPNQMIFRCIDPQGEIFFSHTSYSVGGGVVVDEENWSHFLQNRETTSLPWSSAKELFKLAECQKKTVGQIQYEQDVLHCGKERVDLHLTTVRNEMLSCIDRGLHMEGVLPGRLKLKRRASVLYQKMLSDPAGQLKDPLGVLDWLNIYALSVNEENAAGNRVVTAPTNGAAGIIPALLQYLEKICPKSDHLGFREYLLTATAIGCLYASKASISGAEVGCQGEVGVACSMAAGGMCSALGGTPSQVEAAAEIAMEHNLGLTCDPIGGLVQVPCIERNAMGTVKALNAARIALKETGSQKISLDMVIRTMLATGRDMKSKYRETSRGGLAVNYVLC